MMCRLLVLAAVVVAASALPLGAEDHLALVSEAVAPQDTFLRSQVHDFRTSLETAQTGAHPDEVSQALSDDMDEEFSEQKTLEDLERDNEELGSDDDEPELGETPTSTSSAGSDAALAKAKDEEELAKLDKQAKAAKKLEKKNEHLFDKMGADLQAKADMKKQVKEVQDAAKKALKATGSDDKKVEDLGDSKFDFDKFESKYGKTSSKKSAVHISTTSTHTTEVDADTDDKIKKLDAMAQKLKASETTTEKNMDDVERAYVKQKKTSDEMKKEMADFKKKAKAAASLADKDDPSTELGESSAEMDDEIENLQELQQGVTSKLDEDEVNSMVSRSNHAIQKFANSALDAINKIN